jgi:hypothetical protein
LPEEQRTAGAGQASGALIKPIRLPCEAFEECRQQIVLSRSIQRPFLRYAELVVKTWAGSMIGCPLNFVIVFEGPPGVGKSMAAKAFAETVARCYETRTGQGSIAFHVRAASLFSELLGQSARATAQLLDEVAFSAERRPTFAILDEVDGLAFSRSRTGSADPTEVVRVVDELLRGLDGLRGMPNFLLVATTNVVGLLDAAFVDRADLVLHFADPDLEAGTAILRRAAAEAARLGIHVSEPELRRAAKVLCANGNDRRPSGRLLAKLPFLAYMYGGSASPSAGAMLEVARQAMANEVPS